VQVRRVVAERRVVGEDDTYPAFGGDRGLGHDQPDQQGVSDVPAYRLGQRLSGAGRLDGVLVRRLVFADVQQAGQGVHPIGELVLLGPQGIGEPAHGVQFAQQTDQFGAVAYGDHGAQLPAVQGDRHTVDDEAVVVRQDTDVGARAVRVHSHSRCRTPRPRRQRPPPPP